MIFRILIHSLKGQVGKLMISLVIPGRPFRGIIASVVLLSLSLLLPACSQLSMPQKQATASGSPSAVLPTENLPPTSTIIVATTTLIIVTPIATPSETDVELPTATFTPSATPTATHIPFIYVFPVQPAVLADFSEGVVAHGYPATDIFAPEGTKFVAVTDGIVDYVSTRDTWDPIVDDPATRGGLSVAIIGNDGVRYYGSHLSEVKAGILPGVRVIAGQLLGYIGHTGDARKTESHLHFGISRPSTPDDWKARRGQVDPYWFLFSWRAEQNVTPPLPAP
jgi:peptidoglycan LD-endopeptidase LytH